MIAITTLAGRRTIAHATRTTHVALPTKHCHTPCDLGFFVGEGGLEPPASCSQSRCATNCATPRQLSASGWPNATSKGFPVRRSVPGALRPSFVYASATSCPWCTRIARFNLHVDS